MTPSFMGLMATMLPGVRPSISFASLPTASTSPLFLLMATMDGSLTTMPFPLAKTSVLAVPRSIARSEENRLNRERKFIEREVLFASERTMPRSPEAFQLNGNTRETPQLLSFGQCLTFMRRETRGIGAVAHSRAHFADYTKK